MGTIYDVEAAIAVDINDEKALFKALRKGLVKYAKEDESSQPYQEFRRYYEEFEQAILADDPNADRKGGASIFVSSEKMVNEIRALATETFSLSHFEKVCGYFYWEVEWKREYIGEKINKTAVLKSKHSPYDSPLPDFLDWMVPFVSGYIQIYNNDEEELVRYVWKDGKPSVKKTPSWE